jgi:hypothetical protein
LSQIASVPCWSAGNTVLILWKEDQRYGVQHVR